MKKQKRFFIVNIILIVLVFSMFGIAYAISLAVIENHPLVTSTNTYQFSNDDKVIKNLNFSDNIIEGSESKYIATNVVTVKNIGENVKDTNNKYQIIIYLASTNNDDFKLFINNNEDPLPKYRFTYGNASLYNQSQHYVYTPSNFLEKGGNDNITMKIESNKEFDISLNLVVIRYFKYNTFITSIYDIEYLNNQYLFEIENNNQLDPEAGDPVATLNSIGQSVYIDQFKYLYVLDDLTLVEELTINIPVSINLLFADIKLFAPLTLEHNYGGLFYVDTINGKIINITNDFTINCLFSYYSTDDVNLISEPTNFSKSLWANDVNYRDALIADVERYIKNHIQEYTYSDILLPKSYHQYNITFNYSSSNNAIFKFLSSNGAINISGEVVRPSVNTEATIYTQINYGTYSKVINKNTIVVGTSDSSMCEVYSNILNKYVNDNSKIKDSVLYFNEAIDLRTITTQFIKDSGIKSSFTISLANDTELEILKDNNVVNSLEFVYLNGKYELLEKIDGVNFHKLILKKQQIVALTKDETLTVSLNEVSYSKSFTFKVLGLSIAERNAIVNHYADLLYIASNSPQDILWVNNNKIYRGSELVIDANMQFANFENYFFEMDALTYQDFIDGKINISDILQKYNGSDPRLVVENGMVSVALNKKVKLQPGNELVHVIYGEYSDGGEYLNISTVTIPSDGLGGSDYEKYLSGDTFAPYFNSLEDGMLLIDMDYEGFYSDLENLYLFMYYTICNNKTLNDKTVSILNQNSVPYTTIQQVNENNQIRYLIRIDLEAIPDYDSYIVVNAVFSYDSTDTDLSQRISVQNYDFIIPGIYRYGTHINDILIYNRMLEVYGHYSGYLLIRNAQVEKDLFDASLNTINEKNTLSIVLDNGIVTQTELNLIPELAQDVNGYYATSSYAFDLTGIELLIKTHSMKFNNLKINNLTMFKTENTNLYGLELMNCNINNSIVSGEGLYPLYYLIRLQYLNLSGNYLTESILNTKWAFRTIETLDISNQQNTLSGIKGISQLPLIKNLYINDNKIKYFNALRDCKNLEKVYLYNNLADEFSHVGDNNIYYGTHGKVNIPVYVTLYDRYVDIYVLQDTKFLIIKEIDTIPYTAPVTSVNGYQINSPIYEAALAINAIYYFTTYYVTSSNLFVPFVFRLDISYSSNLNYYTLNFNYLNETLLTASNIIDNDNYYKNIKIAGNGNYKLIANINGIYAIFEFAVEVVS